MGDWRQSSQWGPGAEPLVRGTGGQSSLKLKHLDFERSLKAANLPTFKKMEAQKSDTILVVFAKNEDYNTLMKSKRLVHFG